MAQLTKIATISLWLITSAITGFVLIACSAYLYLSPKLPSVDVLKDVQLQTPLRIYTADQQLIGEFGEKRRRPIGFEQIPPLFVDAILAIEDSRFYEHNGVDIKGLLRAVSQLLLTGQKGSGGSTITMQVAKNYFFSFEKTFSRKFNEILLAIQIEQELSKEEIFELYVNKIFLGKRAYGFEAAAQVYYGKSLTELDLAQLAMLAGLPQSPSVANPIINPERAMIRRNVVLGRMRQLGDIDMEQFQTAMKRPITASFHGTKVTLDVPYVAEMVRKNMLSRYGRAAYTDGYRVYTTLQSSLQNAANDAVLAGLTAYDKRHGYRGPEQNLPPVNDTDDNGESLAAEESPAVDDADTELDNVLTAELTQAQRTRQLWLSALAKSSSPDGFLPAIVTTVDEQAFSALLSDDSEVVVDWESGIQGTRRYLTVDSTSSPVKIAAELVAVGDLIRLRQKPDGSWYLTQLPDAQAALVSLDADNGAILSLVGGFNYNQSKFNRITQATRQPGSNFKPFIYTAALANGFTPASIINDAPIVFEDASLESTWRPTNDGGKFYGPTRLRRALFKSRNLVSIRLLRRLGIPTAIDYVANFGFDPKQLPRDLSLALGSHSLTPLEIVSGYAVLANGGYQVSPFLIARIDSVTGETLFQALPDTVCRDCEKSLDSNPELAEEIEEMASIEDILNQPKTEPALVMPSAKRVVEPRVAYLIDSMLKDVIRKGTGRKARSLGRDDLAGKTGTTNGPTDAWFSGYGGGIATTSWVGFDNNKLLGSREYGGSSALPIWIDYMAVALANREQTQRPQPSGIVTVKIDSATGLLARPGQSNTMFETFREEFAPTTEAYSEDNGGDTGQLEDVMEEDIF